jgi:hypothetical protein
LSHTANADAIRMTTAGDNVPPIVPRIPDTPIINASMSDLPALEGTGENPFQSIGRWLARNYEVGFAGRNTAPRIVRPCDGTGP